MIKEKILLVLLFFAILIIIFFALPSCYRDQETSKDSLIDEYPNSQVKNLLKTFEKDDNYEYEICDDNHNCSMVSINRIIQPSNETNKVCKDDGSCEDVPINRLLLKHGTDKKYCNNSPYLNDDYIDNWWNANGLIDECEMPPKADMQFAFKPHNHSFLSHTATVQITITPINYENNYLALQVLIAEDKNNDDLPDEWIFCGNVDSIRGKDKRIINCKGTMVEFVKLVNPEWNPSSLYFDYILVLKVD